MRCRFELGIKGGAEERRTTCAYSLRSPFGLAVKTPLPLPKQKRPALRLTFSVLVHPYKIDPYRKFFEIDPCFKVSG